MVYKKYIRRGGKLHGPYYYESYRDESGRIKKRYLGTSLEKQRNKGLWIFFLIGFVFLILVSGFVYFSFSDGGFFSSELSNFFVGSESESVLFNPVCGDGVCEVGETKESCVDDCGFCPTVLFDENNNLVVNGEKIFPTGFWAFYWAPPEDWDKFDGHFNVIVSGQTGLYENDYFNQTALENHNLYQFAQVGGLTDLVDVNYENARIIGWEVKHEPFRGDEGEFVNLTIEQALNISRADPCGRPVFVTPSAGTISYLRNVSDYFNLSFTQSAYRVPNLQISPVGLHVNATSSYFDNKPVVMVMNIAGYQPSRYRYTLREPNFGEVRSQAYLGILFGAKGLEFYNFDKGSGDTNTTFEPANSAYNVEDPYSVEHYDNLIAVADDLQAHKEIFFSPFAEDIEIVADDENVFCNIWDVGGEHKLICVNANQNSSEYFDTGSGSTTYSPAIYVEAEGGEIFPSLEEYESSGYLSSKYLKEDLVAAVKRIYTGVTDQQYIFDKFNMTFYEAPVGSSIRFAVYRDSLRDGSPDELLYESQDISVEAAVEKNITFYLDSPLTLEHTMKCYILVKTDSNGVRIPVRDQRYGPRIRDNPDIGGYQPAISELPFLQNFPTLHDGVETEVSIELIGSPYLQYCVERDISGDCVIEQFDGSFIDETFEPYAVHIYHLGYSEESNCGNGVCELDENPSSCPEDCREYPSFYLDMGSLEDNSTNQKIFVDSTNLSERLNEGGVSFRTLSFDDFAEFYVNTSELSLSEQGVPFKDAILSVKYFDDYDETDCSDYLYSSKYSECRHRVDVFLNHSDLDFYPLVGMGGSDDGQWKQENVFIENTPWQTLRSFDDLIRFRFFPNQYSNLGGQWKIDSVNITFVPENEFLLLREQNRQARGLIRSDFVEDYQADYSDQGDYVFYSRNYLEKVYPNSVPREDELVSELEAFEIDGNYEPLTFSIYAVNDLADVNVSVSNLVKGGDIISSDNIEIMNVVYSDLRWSSTGSSGYGKNPNYLDPFNIVNISAGESKQFWLNVFVPEGTFPGVYKGAINVSFENAPEAEINISIEVFDVELMDAEAFPVIYGDPEYNDFIDDGVVLQDIAEHGLYPIFNFDPAISYSSTEQKVTGIDYGEEVAKFALWQDYGLVHKRLPIFINDDKKWRIWQGGCGGDSDYYERVCEEFDEEYGEVVLNYSDFVESYGLVDPHFSFLDEPHVDPAGRRAAVRLNLIAKENDVSTWVTYKTFTDMPLAGHYISFYDKPNAEFTESWPDSVSDGLEMHLDFEEGFEDVSGNGFNGIPGGDAHISEGALVMDQNDFVQIDGTFNSNDSTVIVVFEPSSNAGVFQRILRFDNRLTLSYRGSDEYLLMRTYDSEGTLRTPFPNTYLCELDELCFVVGSYSDEFGSQKIYLTGEMVDNALDESDDGLRVSESNYIGSAGSNENFEGRIESVLVFNRSLSDQEIQELFAYNSIPDYNRKQEFNLATEILVDEETPQALSFSLSDDDGIGLSAPLKKVLVDDVLVWERANLDYEHQVFEVDISPYIAEDGLHKITVSLVNNITFDDEILIYFMGQYWRDAVWDYESNSENWSATFIPDEYFDNFGPVGPYIDERIYHLSSVTGGNARRVNDEGKTFGYYTTYQANMPYPINNRFLNGLYAESLNVSYVMVYAYHSNIGDPYDDLSMAWQSRDFDGGLRGNVDYNLVYPSWDGEIRRRIIYESLREGVEDARIISTLENAIQNNPGNLADEAQAYLDNLMSRFSEDFNPDYTVSGRTESWLREDISRKILLDLSGEADAYEEFDEARRQMIGHIIALENQETPVTPPGDGPDNPGDNPGIPTSNPISSECDDGLDNDRDGLVDYPVDSGCSSSEDNSELDFEQPTGPGGCEELWDCGTWGDCVDGVETRECTDLRECGTESNKPDIERFCEFGANLEGFWYDAVFAGVLTFVGLAGIVVALVLRRIGLRKKLINSKIEVRQ